MSNCLLRQGCSRLTVPTAPHHLLIYKVTGVTLFPSWYRKPMSFSFCHFLLLSFIWELDNVIDFSKVQLLFFLIFFLVLISLASPFYCFLPSVLGWSTSVSLFLVSLTWSWEYWFKTFLSNVKICFKFSPHPCFRDIICILIHCIFVIYYRFWAYLKNFSLTCALFRHLPFDCRDFSIIFLVLTSHFIPLWTYCLPYNCRFVSSVLSIGGF